MASTQTSLNNHFFGGIRRKDSMFTEDKITCSDCQNVELYFTELNSGVGIRTAKGNIGVGLKISTMVDEEEHLSPLPEGEEIIGIFETVQNGDTYTIVYTETGNKGSTGGKLYSLDARSNKLHQLLTGLTVTGKSQGVDFHATWADIFAFSNGEEIKYIYTSFGHLDTPLAIAGVDDTEWQDDKLTLNLTDVEGNPVKGLGMVNLYGRLWVFDGVNVWWSCEGAFGDFNTTTSDTTVNTNPGVWHASKEVTAIHEYLGSLAVFHKDSSQLITEDGTTGFKASDESPGGCASYDSLVFHGTDLFFYDDTKKGVFSFQQVINGDKTLSDNIAYDIQDELMEFDKNDLYKIRALSVVTADRNEIWFLAPTEVRYTTPVTNEQGIVTNVTKTGSLILIYDYIRGEWVKRVCQHINCMNVLDSVLHSAGTDMYQEYQTNYFNGDFIQNFYECTVLNLGTDNTLKITKFPPRLTVDASSVNHFFVKYIKNYNVSKKPKVKELTTKMPKNILIYNVGQYDDDKVYKPDGISGTIKMPSATFKALQITFYTTGRDQQFTIKSLEFSRLKVKQV